MDCSSEPPALKLRDDVSGRVLSESFMDNSQVRLTRYNLTPFSRIRIFLKVEIFFSVLVFCLPSTHKRRFRAPKTQVSKTVPRVAYSFCVEWPKAEVFEYDDVIHRDRKREEMTKISASREVFFNTNFSNTVWFVSPMSLYYGYTSMLQVNPFLDFSLYNVNIHAGMIVSTK